MSDEITVDSVEASHLRVQEGHFDQMVEMIHGDGYIETDKILVKTEAGRELVITANVGNIEVRRP